MANNDYHFVTEWSFDATVDEVASILEEMHQAGKGVVGMKIVGQGEINTPDRIDASLRYVLGLGSVQNPDAAGAA